MTDSTTQLVGRLNREVRRGGSSAAVSLFVATARMFGFFVRDVRTDRLMLPVRAGGNFTLKADNGLPIMGAFPARLGTADGRWLNLYPGQSTDPSEVPATHMLETPPNGQTTFNGLREPGSVIAPFVAEPGGGFAHEGTLYDRIQVFYRYPSDPNAIPGLPAGAVAKESSGGHTRSYRPGAHSFGVIHLVDRVDVLGLLARVDLGDLDPTDDYQWTAAYLREVDKGSLLTDTELTPAVG